MFAFNDSPYRGAYMTDILKGVVEANSRILLERIRRGSIDVQKHIDTFRTEMQNLGAQEHTLFILFGGDANRIFTNYLADIYPNHVKIPHYSSRGTDAEWVEKSWDVLEEHCVATKSSFNTLEFTRNDLMRGQLKKLKDKQLGK